MAKPEAPMHDLTQHASKKDINLIIENDELPSVGKLLSRPGNAKLFAVVIPSASSKEKLGKDDAMRRYLQVMPNEILMHIFGYLPAGGKELETIRLLSRSFAALAKSAYFRAVTLPGNLDRLRTAIDVLTREDISSCIREIRVRIHAMVPRKELNEAGHFNAQYSSPEDKSKVPSWSSRFTILLMRLLLTTSNKLEAIRVDSVKENFITGSGQALEKAFANCVAELLNTINFPELCSLRLNFPEVTAISRFYKVYSQSSATILDQNMGRLQELCYQNKTNIPIVVDRRFIYWISQLTSIQQLTLSMVKDGGFANIYLSPLANARTLKTLRLRFIMVEDSLSAVLSNLDLQHLGLYFITLHDKKDRWGTVCEAIAAMGSLRILEMQLLDYSRLEGCECEGMCSPYGADRRAYDKLKSWAKGLAREGKMKCRPYGLAMTCECLDNYEQNHSHSDDSLHDI